MKILFIMLMVMVLAKSCGNRSDATIESSDTLIVSVNKGELIEYDTSIDNLLGAVTVEDSTNHHLLSVLLTDSTEFNIFHRYQPEANFIGYDTLVLRSERINDVSDDVISVKNLMIVLKVD